MQAEQVETAIHETLTYYAYPPQHWLKLKTNNPMERLLKEARRRTKVVGAFPDGHSALMLWECRPQCNRKTRYGFSRRSVGTRKHPHRNSRFKNHKPIRRA
ncbi:MAG: transposase [Candidatus Thiodiazotropha sp.]